MILNFVIVLLVLIGSVMCGVGLNVILIILCNSVGCRYLCVVIWLLLICCLCVLCRCGWMMLMCWVGLVCCGCVRGGMMKCVCCLCGL